MSIIVIAVELLSVICFACSSLQYYSFSGNHLKFIAFHNPPYDTFVRGPNGNFTYFGTSHNIIKWMGTKFNFTFTIVPVNRTLEEKHGTHEASFYQLINDETIDGISCAFYITLDRKERMDFTYPTWSEGFRLIVPRPGEESRLFAFVRPFQPKVWLLILSSFTTIVCMLTIFEWLCTRYFPKYSKTKQTIVENNCNNTIWNYISCYAVYVTSILTNQGSREVFRPGSFRILTGFWLLGATVLVNSYSGMVISSFTVPRMRPTINSFEDLAASQDVGVILRHDVSIGEQILQATSGVYKVLGDKARRHPDQIVGDPFKLNIKLETGKFAYPFVQTFCSFFIAAQYKKERHCRFQMSQPLSISTGYYSYLFKKGNPHAPVFSTGIVSLWESGLVRFWVKNTIPRADECFAAKKKKDVVRQVSIRLYELTSAFLILGIGLGLAILCFLTEMLKYRLLMHSSTSHK